MAVTLKDIAALAKGMAPAINYQIAKATEPLHQRIAALEGKAEQRMITRDVDDAAAMRAIEGGHAHDD